MGTACQAIPSGVGRAAEDRPFGHDHVQSVGDISEPTEARCSVAGGFLPVQLLLGHTEGVGEVALGPAEGDPGFDEQSR